MTVFRAISRIHHQIFHPKRVLAISLQLLEQLRHQHRIFSTRNADRHPVAFFYQFILTDRLREIAPDTFMKLLADALLHRLADLLCLLFFHLAHQPADITAFQTICLIATATQFFRYIHTNPAAAADDDQFLSRIFWWILQKLLLWNRNRARDRSMGNLSLSTHIDHIKGSRLQFFQFFYGNIHVHFLILFVKFPVTQPLHQYRQKHSANRKGYNA